MNDLQSFPWSAWMIPTMVIWVRISAFLAFMPFFNAARGSAMMAKTAFGLLMAILLVSTLPIAGWSLPTRTLGYSVLLMGEMITGIAISLWIMILFMALQILGHIFGFQMAFSMARVIDASIGEQSNVISVMFTLIGTVFFLSLGGDHLLLWGLRASFDLVPPGTLNVNQGTITILVEWIKRMFELGIRISLPGIILLLAVDLTLGLVGRVASKMQIFFVGLPLKVTMGLYLFVVGLGFVLTEWGRSVNTIPSMLAQLFESMRA